MDFYGILFDMKNGSKMPYSKNYFDTLLAAKLEELSVKTLTGTLPLTFRTSETALRSWTIYGNNTPHNYSAEGTLPLTFTTHTAGNADDWVIYGNDDNGTENLFDGTIERGGWTGTIGNETSKYPSTNRVRCSAIFDTLASDTYTVACYPTTLQIAVILTDANGNVTQSTSWNNAHTINNLKNCVFIIRKSDNTDISPSDIEGVCIVKGSTAPDHYIPYQKGVGERTKNICTSSTAQTKTNGALSVTTDGQGRYNISISQTISTQVSVSFDLPEFTMPISVKQGGNGTFSMFNTIKSGICISFYYNDTIIEYWYLNSTNRQSDSYISMGNKRCNKISFVTNGTAYAGTAKCAIMFTNNGILPATYIPYGYEIPLTVSQSGQTDKTYDIYIGDSPLTEGETVSKQSTGVDLELFEGINTVSTTLYNKPETSITYTDYLGVGEYVNGQWQIPLTLSHITDNLFDKDATDTDNGYEDDTRTYWRQAIYGLRLITEPNADYCTSEYIPVTAGTDYYPSDVDISIEALFSATFYTAEKTLIYMAFSSADKITAPENAAYIRVCVEKSKLNSAMLTTKPTSEYIPHKQSTDYTIPIDAPLTDGQSVSDTVEITAYEGTNTLDTTLTVKPDATITYK